MSTSEAKLPRTRNVNSAVRHVPFDSDGRHFPARPSPSPRNGQPHGIKRPILGMVSKQNESFHLICSS
jgi:hypothetical protein